MKKFWFYHHCRLSVLAVLFQLIMVTYNLNIINHLNIFFSSSIALNDQLIEFLQWTGKFYCVADLWKWFSSLQRTGKYLYKKYKMTQQCHIVGRFNFIVTNWNMFWINTDKCSSDWIKICRLNITTRAAVCAL